MSVDFLIKTSHYQASMTKAHQPSVDRQVIEPDLIDVQQFELKTAQLQQTSAVQTDNTSVSSLTEKATAETKLMDLFQKQLTDSILKDIIMKCKVEIDKD